MRRCALMLLLVLAPACSDGTGGMFVPEEVQPANPATNPVLIPSSKVDPIYPEGARVARVEGRVILRTTISSAGDVSDVQPLLIDPPGWEFETAAIDAVAQWKYEPATQNSQPVEVLSTVIVDFTLH